MANYYVGLMSGTSLDAIDCVVVDFSSDIKLIAAASYPLIDNRKASILELCQPGHDEIDKMGHLDRQLGIDFASAVTTTLENHQLSNDDIIAIGSHGQTIRHRPSANDSLGFTLQIGDPNTIAYLTGIDTVADFRRKDIAAGGQGAPLVPAFHQAAFSKHSTQSVLLNIGGMANISLLENPLLGYDTGPGNVLIDHYCRQYFQQNFDHSGAIASSGIIHSVLLELLLSHPFIYQPAPKSCGRENFDSHWVDALLSEHGINIAGKDLIATLTEFTAKSIAIGISQSGRKIDKIIVCGGGAFNDYLCQRISFHCGVDVVTSNEFGIDPQWVEATAFAWFAMRTIQRLHSNAPSVTGAQKELVLGAIYSAN
jgi:anhydro-N-acetylmuramic acid kinase